MSLFNWLMHQNMKKEAKRLAKITLEKESSFVFLFLKKGI